MGRYNTNRILFFLLLAMAVAACKKDDHSPETGTFVDIRDNREYKWVKIGDQIWMAENFAYYFEPFSIDADNGMRQFGFNYKKRFDAAEVEKYQSEHGCLYSYKAAIKYCPSGWHLPSDLEWMELEEFLGVKKDELGKCGERGIAAKAGSKLKEGGTANWDTPNVGIGVLNSSGFSARPGGGSAILDYNSNIGKARADYDIVNYMAKADGEDNIYVRQLWNDKYGIARTRYADDLKWSYRFLSVRYVKDK